MERIEIRLNKKINSFYLFDIIALSIFTVFCEIIGRLLQNQLYFVSLGSLIVIISLYRWRYKGSVVCFVWGLVRLYFYNKDSNLATTELILISVILPILLVSLVPIIKLESKLKKNFLTFIGNMIISYLILVVFGSALLSLFGNSFQQSFSEMMFENNFSIIISTLIGLLLFIKGDLFTYMPDYFRKESIKNGR